ncbi:MAG: hypothetical protein AAF654_11465 [Myxococcota bacterium]
MSAYEQIIAELEKRGDPFAQQLQMFASTEVEDAFVMMILAALYQNPDQPPTTRASSLLASFAVRVNIPGTATPAESFEMANRYFEANPPPAPLLKLLQSYGQEPLPDTGHGREQKNFIGSNESLARFLETPPSDAKKYSPLDRFFFQPKEAEDS